MQQISEDR